MKIRAAYRLLILAMVGVFAACASSTKTQKAGEIATDVMTLGNSRLSTIGMDRPASVRNRFDVRFSSCSTK